MPAQNTPRPQPIARPDTQQGIQLAYQAKPARRTHHRLLTPPLAQKNGIDPIQLILPRVEELPAELTPNNTAPATIADYELPPVSWTTKIKSKKQEAFHVYKSGNKTRSFASETGSANV